MNVAVAVKVVEGLESLLEDGSDSVLLEAVGESNLDEVEAGALVHKGHDHPEAPLHGKGAVGPHHVGVVDEAHGLGLPTQVVEIDVATIEIQGLDGHELVEGEIHRSVHRGCGAITNFF